jgi:hypothetical protein
VGAAEFKAVVKNFFPEKHLEINRRAFETGQKKVAN